MTDERELDTRDVRAWLAAVEAPPQRLSVQGALTAGRLRERRRRRTRLAVTASAAGLAMIAGVPAATGAWNLDLTRPDDPAPAESASPDPVASATTSPPPADCAVTPLVVPDGLAARDVKDAASVNVVAMDPSGRYVVGDTYGGFNASPAVVLWDNGVGRILPTAPPHATVVAVNSSGVVVGNGAGEGNNDPWFGWVYRDGKVTRLPLPSGYTELFEVEGINEAGDIVGNVNNASHTKTALVVWPAAAPDRPRVLTAPARGAAIAAAITDDGTVLGWIPGQSGGYLWAPDGTGRALPLPAGATGAEITEASGRWAIGLVSTSQTPGNANAPMKWDLQAGTVTPIDLPPGVAPTAPAIGRVNAVSATAVNAAGDVVISGPADVLLRRGQVLRLPAPAAGLDANPVAVNAAGTRVAGSIRNGDEATAGSPRPVVWQC